MNKLLLLMVLPACQAAPEVPVPDPVALPPSHSIPRGPYPPGPLAGAPAPDQSISIADYTIHYKRPPGAGLLAAAGAHCGRCNTRWGKEDLAAHERHVTEQNLMMSTDCKLCVYHGAYKNMLVRARSPAERKVAKAKPSNLLQGPLHPGSQQGGSR